MKATALWWARESGLLIFFPFRILYQELLPPWWSEIERRAFNDERALWYRKLLFNKLLHMWVRIFEPAPADAFDENRDYFPGCSTLDDRYSLRNRVHVRVIRHMKPLLYKYAQVGARNQYKCLCKHTHGRQLSRKLVSYKEKDMQEEAIALSTRRSTSRYGFFPLPALQRVRVTRTRWRQDVQSCFVTNDVSLPLSSRMLSYMTIYGAVRLNIATLVQTPIWPDRSQK